MRWAILLMVVGVTMALPSHFVFVKFFKVGGTTVADVLGRLAERDHRQVCCGQVGCEVCYTHNAMFALKKMGIAAFHPEAQLITLLRDPIERELSRYFYNRARGERFASELRLERWVARVENEYTQALGHGDVAVAKEVLNRYFALVGVTDRMHEFMSALGLLLGEPPQEMAYKSLKRVVGRPTQQEVSQQAMATLRVKLDKDMQVYQHAAELFDRQWLASGSGHTRSAYAAELERVRPNASCEFRPHKGAPKLTGHDCLRARP